MKSVGWTKVFLLPILMQIDKQMKVAACGQLGLETQIINGSDTHHWPWHAAIYHQYNETDIVYKCGGTLVGSKFVLTAAHCVTVAATQASVSLGRLYLNESALLIKVAEILRHPDYNSSNHKNDIAVITLSKDAIFNDKVQPICLWKSDKIDLAEVIDKFGTVVGWGLTEEGEISNHLQEASLPVVDFFTCLYSDPTFFRPHLSHKNFCAGFHNGALTCSGDSGGSMTFHEDGRYYIRGIVSVGGTKITDRKTNKKICDSTKYTIFTDVAQYLPWIREKIGTTECETPVRCDWSESIDTCTLILTVEDTERKCKIILDEMSSEAVKWLVVSVVSGDGSTVVPDMSNAVDKFTKLETLKLHHFKLVERSRLSPFRNILWLSFNRFLFSQLDADTFVDLNNLEQLFIRNSNLMTIPAGIFRNNNKIRKLVLTSNHLIELHPDVFENIRNVNQLWIENNKLAALPANIFRSNEKMRELKLASNQLREIHEDLFNGLINLETLDLSGNLIEYLPPRLFRMNSNLLSVDLSNNKIRKVGVDLTTMPQLDYFYLSGNDCTNKDFDFPKDSVSEANEIIRRYC